MSVLSDLTASVQSFDSVPATARILQKETIFEGPGGAWRAGIWFLGLKRMRAVVVPVQGGQAVALKTVWADSQSATASAEDIARFCAEVEVVDA